ncbi:hypothetical protein ASPNIDRAFT_130414 [Aspergillus niger ATCC 1015]|uniref:Uncharacterized protein n=1 Tax=Aspergillus niger (strain ATCC 1015 / CBS 113.46 / FGSC A1144 / LSHB Ac4 / NCTC 3858a / NRRL 328 / USDA 3528.7) TaxID=380704 RepID=G3XVW0_ASPNA|nr:hypothetical protein ASPNIDRAFT_130414 [Aspergillus niger ATCC 1015]
MSVTIITINLSGKYIGADFMSPVKSETINLLLLQLIAKSHEIMVVASLSVVVMDFVRHELIFGGGVPLGLISAGINFNRFDLFLRKELYGSLGYTGAHGKASQVPFFWSCDCCFLVPKSQVWRVGSKTFPIVGAESQFWPHDLSGNMSGLHQPYRNGSSTTAPFPFCSAGGYHSLPSSLIPLLYALGDTFLVQAHAAVTTALQRLAETWWNVFIAYNDLLPNYLDDRIISAEVCSAITKLRFSWVLLPPEFGAVSIGDLSEPAWDLALEDGLEKEIVVGCSVQTGWVPSTIFTDKYRFWTGWNPWNIKFKSRTPAWDPNSGASTNGRVSFGFEWLNLWAPKAPIKGSDTWGPSTIKNISSNTALLGYAQINITGATSLEGWLNDRELGQKKVAMLEAIIGSVVVDGLSRTGSYQLVANSGHSPGLAYQIPKRKQTAGNASCSSQHEFTTTEADMKISGFSLRGSLASDLAMPTLLTHMILAIIHVILVVYRWSMSGSWTSLGELLPSPRTPNLPP